ncbi:MAG: ABC transporter substrate-binding protein [Clostridia bacterium]|nr:ABC transporter substrate-binding protein [Clostridia bacterium]
MKKLFALLCVCILSLSACALADEPVRVAALKGPTAMGLVQLFETHAEDYDVLIAGAADEVTPKLIQGQIDIAAVPVNLGSVLYNRTEGQVQLIAINTLGVLYVVEKGGETVSSLEDLKGKTIYATGKGSTPEYALTYLLAQHGIDIASDVTMEWKSEPTEVVALMAQSENAVAMLPQPYVTVAGAQVEGLRVALNLTEEWDKLDNGSRLITAGIIVRKEFAEEHPDKVAAFLEQFAQSAAFANENVAEAAALVEKYIGVKAPVAQKALPACNIVCIAGEDAAAILPGYLQTLYDLNPAAVGGALPGEDFYWVNEK